MNICTCSNWLHGVKSFLKSIYSHSASQEISHTLWKHMCIHIHGLTLYCLQNISSISELVFTVLTLCLINICGSLWEFVYRNFQHRKKKTVTWRRLLNSQHHWLYPLRILMFVTFTLQHLNHQVFSVYRNT